MWQAIKQRFQAFLDSPNTGARRPVLNANLESNVPGLFVVGDLAGAPVLKLAMQHGQQVAQYIAGRGDARSTVNDAYDVAVIGAGAAGLTAALSLQQHGLRVLVLEKGRIASTIEDFPEGKWIYDEPDSLPATGDLWLQASTREDLLARWRETVKERRLAVREGEGLASLTRREDGHFELRTKRAEQEGAQYVARRVVLAIGQRGNPRWLKAPGEDSDRVHHRLYSPKTYRDEDIVVVGGGNSAAEAALSLAENNHVALVHRGDSLSRLFKANRQKVDAAVSSGQLLVHLNTQVEAFHPQEGEVALRRADAQQADRIPCDRAFVLIGAEFPSAFLKQLGLRLENEWSGSFVAAVAFVLAVLGGLWLFGGQTGVGILDGWVLPGALLAAGGIGALFWQGFRGSRFAWLGIAFLVSYTIYGAKLGAGYEFWPYRGWGYDALSIFNRPWAFWYTVLYTAVMTVFGVQAMKRWGFDRKDKFQIWRYSSLLGFQWVFFFLIPEFLFQMAVRYQWVGQQLATDPNFAENAWRSYGIVYAWPLFFYTFFSNPHQIWMVWGAVLAFGFIPLLVLFHGKRYCSWICGCGGLAETLGDRWRHLAPKGEGALRWERMHYWVLGVAVVVTLLMVGRDALYFFRQPAQLGVEWYRLIADVWLVGVVPVALYPFFGGKMWCRYWCPLASMMQVFSRFFTRSKLSHFAIYSNEKCIACGECTRYCQVGIDVMRFAMKQEELNNANSSCIGCGICVTVCPMDVLSFQPGQNPSLVQISNVKAA
jgi:NosR/NirI family transcriptional regulator, nitrous oxide reductase regulator